MVDAVAKKHQYPIIPRSEISKARTEDALFALAVKFGRGDRAARLFAQRTLQARAARGAAMRSHIGINRRKEAYRKGREL